MDFYLKTAKTKRGAPRLKIETFLTSSLCEL